MRFVVATKLKFSQQKLIFPYNKIFFCSLFLYYMNECLFFVNKIQTINIIAKKRRKTEFEYIIK